MQIAKTVLEVIQEKEKRLCQKWKLVCVMQKAKTIIKT